MSWVETKLKLALQGFEQVRDRLTLEEYLEILKIGYRVHCPEGYTYSWLKEEMEKNAPKFKDEKSIRRY